MSVGGGCLAANSASTRAGLAVVLLAAAACYLVAAFAIGQWRKAQKCHHISQESPAELFGSERVNDAC